MFHHVSPCSTMFHLGKATTSNLNSWLVIQPVAPGVLLSRIEAQAMVAWAKPHSGFAHAPAACAAAWLVEQGAAVELLLPEAQGAPGEAQLAEIQPIRLSQTESKNLI